MTAIGDDLLSEARGYYGDGSAHGWEHARRVKGLAITIADHEGADKTVVSLGALLHDIGRKKESEGEVQDHAAWGAGETAKMLTEYGYDDGTVEAVAHCVETHRYSAGPEPETKEASVVADADDIDAVGAVGIGRAFAHGGGFDGTAEHIREKLLSLRDRMRTEAGREVAEDRHRFTEEFLRRFEREREPNDV